MKLNLQPSSHVDIVFSFCQHQKFQFINIQGTRAFQFVFHSKNLQLVFPCVNQQSLALHVFTENHVFFLLESSTSSFEGAVLCPSSSFVSISGLPSWYSSSVSNALASSSVDYQRKLTAVR